MWNTFGMEELMEKERHGERSHGRFAAGGVLILAVALFILAACFGRVWAAPGDGGFDSRDQPVTRALDGSHGSGGSPADPGTGGNVAADNDATVLAEHDPPEVTELDPPCWWAGNGGFKLTVKGKNLWEPSKVLWNNEEREATYDYADKELVATIHDDDVLDPQTATVKVRNGDGQESNIVYYEVKKKGDAPVIAGLDPPWVWAGTKGFDLTVTGENFVEGAVVEWNGGPWNSGPRWTRYIDPTKLAATIFYSDILDPRTSTVQVKNGDGQESNIVNFEIKKKSDAPEITGLEPSSVKARSGTFILKVTGKYFRRGSAVTWNSEWRPTTYENETVLKATIWDDDILDPINVSVRVQTPDPNPMTSNAMIFRITPPPPGPKIESIKPSAAKAGGDGFTLKVKGNNFGEGSEVRWNLASRDTQYDGGTGELTASIRKSDISTPHVVTVTVKNADRQVSGAAVFTIMEAEGLEPPFPIVIPPPSRKATTTEKVRVKGRYLTPITSVTVDRKDGGPCAIEARGVIVEETSVCFDMVMPGDTAGGEHVIRLHYGQDEPQTLDVPMTIIIARSPTPHP